MTIAVCPGSFDPITLGHVDVIRRAHTLFDTVIVGVGRNSRKNYWFSAEERMELACGALVDIPNVQVELMDGLVATFAHEHGAIAIVKGLRGTADFDNEQAMALLNRHLTGVETVLIIGDSTKAHIASSFVKDIALYGGKFEDLVPANVARALRERVQIQKKGSSRE
ncbi:MAG: pantetheine-phosphate adenylyltransferase [Actinomycetaceae bacterium]|nr:pantetheine-phosphate adenylyltransferase [Actinomycetaceae bacterium]MDY5854649.1 pantetheine-phosphate adenylyltransferase [Arcanobacterium sp.]